MISLIRELGQGSFGMVYEGILFTSGDDEKGTTVAVKVIIKSPSIFLSKNPLIVGWYTSFDKLTFFFCKWYSYLHSVVCVRKGSEL